MVKIAIFADIRGNITALAAVLTAIAEQGGVGRVASDRARAASVVFWWPARLLLF